MKSELFSLSLRDLFYKYARFLPVFILSVAVALFGAYAYLRYATPIYSVAGSMYIKSDKQGARSDKFEDIFVNDKAANIQSEIEVLRSKPLMQRVVEKLNLQLSYYAIGKIKTTNIYKQGPFLIEPLEITDSSRAFVLKIKFINSNKFRINDQNTEFHFDQIFKNTYGVFRLKKNFGNSAGAYQVNWQPAPSAASSFASAVQVAPKSLGTGILTLSMQTPNSMMGADVINVLMDEYALYTIDEKNKASEQIISFIEDRSRLLGRELDSIQDVLLDYSQKNNIIDIDAQSGGYFQSINEYDKVINEQQFQIDVTDLVRDYLTDKQNAYTKVVVPSPLTLSDATLSGLVAGYNLAQMERASMLESNITPGNPLIKEKETEIEKLRQSLLENLKNIRKSYTHSIAELKARSSTSQSQLQALPFKAKKYHEIRRLVESKQSLYQLLQEKKEETSISKASNVASSKVIDKAYPSNTPLKPNRRSIQIMAILLGLGIPAMIIFIGEVLNDKVATRFDIEKITPAPILGEVGHSYSEKPLLVTKTTRSMVAEQFRIIRSNLQYIVNKVDKSVILITSSFSGEGKSFISINMGAVLALAGKKTIILEFDIRKPKVLSGLGMTKGPGITNYLVGKASLADIIRPVEGHENLYVLGCGPIPPNPSELLLDQRVEDMFIWLRNNFDVILVDTAPVGMVSDSLTLSKFSDCTLYIVRQGHTFKKQIALIDEFYQENRLPKVSIIINDVKMKPGYGYYGYGRYGYGYGYGYGSYYEEEHPPKTFLDRALAAMDIRRWFKTKNN
ncbi:MAG TPA: polysaccharide biosynthesis tyrosine autokinase [Chitinophagaceae bacterium]